MSKSFNLATANKVELKAYALKELDLKLSMVMNEDTMRERILAQCEKLQREPPQAVIQTKHDKAKKETKTVLINVAKSDKPGGNEPAFVAVQGVGYLIPRGINVWVSPSIVEVLKNAITDNVTQDQETGELLHDETPTYPFSVVQKAA